MKSEINSALNNFPLTHGVLSPGMILQKEAVTRGCSPGEAGGALCPLCRTGGCLGQEQQQL